MSALQLQHFYGWGRIPLGPVDGSTWSIDPEWHYNCEIVSFLTELHAAELHHSVPLHEAPLVELVLPDGQRFSPALTVYPGVALAGERSVWQHEFAPRVALPCGYTVDLRVSAIEGARMRAILAVHPTSLAPLC